MHKIILICVATEHFSEINCSSMTPSEGANRRGLTRSETYPKMSKKELLSAKNGPFKNKIKYTWIILICVATERIFEINCSTMTPSEGTNRRGLTRPETYPKIIEIGSRSSENGHIELSVFFVQKKNNKRLIWYRSFKQKMHFFGR